MRKTENLNTGWYFSRSKVDAAVIDIQGFEPVSVPHTWNAEDGADGGGDYWRGTCTYFRDLPDISPAEGERVFLEFRGVAMSAEVYLNGAKLCEHKGGYSTFRADITDHLSADNRLVVYADNSPRRDVYPQKADFTFFGGIYRDVSLITVPAAHFDLDYWGGPGIKVTPRTDGTVDVESYLVNSDGETVEYEIFDHKGQPVSRGSSPVIGGKSSAALFISDVHLWGGVDDPYLYTLRAAAGNDMIETRFGVREFMVDPEKGFFLNGKHYDLIGVSRHQDREGAGYALTREMHLEDLEMIRETGATSIRLAHYQHDSYVYDLADEMGFIVWAEIPYISEHMDEACENTLSQMKELIIQNYNHPSIICWGLSNEITVVGGMSRSCYENHRRLNDLCHELDETRYTTMANLFLLEPDSPLVTLPDLRSYNLYYGWYVGDVEDTEKWLDDFHKAHPDLAIGLSEFGADANPSYQSPHPEKGDYTETYQAEYHEHLLEMRMSRPWIWAMHAWNMFDFAADARDEGGVPGRNQKGLVTYDRKTKKDAFYVYKAYLSKYPFVHIAGRRYVNRAEETTRIKVYSNLDHVKLYVDGLEFAELTGSHSFTFEVPISGTHRITAVSGDLSDEITVTRVSEPDRSYACRSPMEVSNWFDGEQDDIDPAYFSIKDTVREIKDHPQAGMIYSKMMEEAAKSFGDLAKNVQIPREMQERMDAMTLEANLKMAGHMIKADMVKSINGMLQKIKK